MANKGKEPTGREADFVEEMLKHGDEIQPREVDSVTNTTIERTKLIFAVDEKLSGLDNLNKARLVAAAFCNYLDRLESPSTPNVMKVLSGAGRKVLTSLEGFGAADPSFNVNEKLPGLISVIDSHLSHSNLAASNDWWKARLLARQTAVLIEELVNLHEGNPKLLETQIAARSILRVLTQVYEEMTDHGEL